MTELKTQREIDAEILRRRDIINSDLYKFYLAHVATEARKPVPADHIMRLADELMALYRGDFKDICISMPPRHNLENNTPVLTTKGWKTHGELNIGDYVYGINGKPTKITGVSEENLCDQLVKFSDGSEIIANKSHLWLVNDEVLTTEMIKTGMNNGNVFYLPVIDSEKLAIEHPANLRIVSIIDVEGGMGKCIKISNPDGVYLVGENLIPTHNSKSSMATIAFPLWCLLHDPTLNIIIVTHSKNLCETQGIRLRECVKRFGHEFGIKISSTKKSSTSFRFDDLDGNLLSGSVHLVTVGSKDITGFDCDILIIDDPYSADLSDFTPSALEKIIDWYKLKIVQRKEPQTRRIILHTRYHSNDLIGYLKRNSSDLYHFITFPAIKPNGEFLWPERGNQNEILEAKKEMGERLFNAIYQQRPLDLDGDFFDMKAIKFDLEEPDVVRTVRGWDLGGTRTEEMNDFTAGALMVRTSNDECVLMDMKHGKYGKTTMDTVVRTAELDTQFVTIVGETGAAGSADILEEEWKKYLPGYNFVRARMPTTSKKGLAKQDNATPLKNCIHDGRFYINIKDMVLRADILEEMSQFPLGKHDDMIDAMAHAYNELFGMGKTAAVGVAYLKNRKRNNNGVRAW